MAFYETTFIARQDVSSAQVESFAKEFSDIVSQNGGKVERTENWGLRTLAYPVNKNKRGHYVMFQISGAASAISELERQFRIHEDIIRYMTVKIEALSKEPSVMAKDKAA